MEYDNVISFTYTPKELRAIYLYPAIAVVIVRLLCPMVIVPIFILYINDFDMGSKIFIGIPIGALVLVSIVALISQFTDIPKTYKRLKAEQLCRD